MTETTETAATEWQAQQTAFSTAGLGGPAQIRQPAALPARGETLPEPGRPWMVGTYAAGRSRFVGVAAVGSENETRRSFDRQPNKPRRVYWQAFEDRQEARDTMLGLAIGYDASHIWQAQPGLAKAMLWAAYSQERIYRADASEDLPTDDTPNPLPIRITDIGLAFRRAATARELRQLERKTKEANK